MRIRKRLAPPLSDLHLPRSEPPPPDQSNTWVFPKNGDKMKQKEFGDDDDHMNTNNDIRKIVSICHREEGFNKNVMPSTSSLHEGYKLVPLKKRKGSLERSPKEEGAAEKMKSKTNKKHVHGDLEENGKKSSYCTKRGNVIMEGSRCSRVNGRGWRCCQPTLVGYSLCEHHLGKGRLRLTKKKRTKVGVVKARSITTLLSQI